jgi:hypothetical protein
MPGAMHKTLREFVIAVVKEINKPTSPCDFPNHGIAKLARWTAASTMAWTGPQIEEDAMNNDGAAALYVSVVLIVVIVGMFAISRLAPWAIAGRRKQSRGDGSQPCPSLVLIDYQQLIQLILVFLYCLGTSGFFAFYIVAKFDILSPVWVLGLLGTFAVFFGLGTWYAYLFIRYVPIGVVAGDPFVAIYLFRLKRFDFRNLDRIEFFSVHGKGTLLNGPIPVKVKMEHQNVVFVIRDESKDQDVAVVLVVDREQALQVRGYARRHSIDVVEGDVAEWSQAILDDPKDASALRERGYMWWKQGKYERAVRDFTRAIRLEPSNAQAYVNRAVNRLMLREYDAALGDVNEAIHLHPSDPSDRGFAEDVKKRILAAIEPPVIPGLVETQREEDTIVVRLLPARLVDDNQIRAVGELLLTLPDRFSNIVVDFAKVELLSSALIGKLVLARKKLFAKCFGSGKRFGKFDDAEAAIRTIRQEEWSGTIALCSLGPELEGILYPLLCPKQ